MKNETDMELAVNTFGMGGPLRKDFHMTIESLLNHRITSVEPCILFLDKGNVLEKALTKAKRGIDKLGGVWTPDEAEKKISLMREAGLRVEGAHLFKKNITRSTAVRAAMFAKKNNLSYYVLSYAEEKVEKVDKYIPLLRDACTIFEQYGIHLLIHNHSVDLNEMKGLCVFDFLLENVPGLEIQMDLGWVHYAGKDCMNLMERYKDRIRLLHFKDIWPGGDAGKIYFAAIGEGAIPLADIMKKAKELSLISPGLIIDINDCKSFLEAVPGLGLVFDTANMIPKGDDPLVFYEELKTYICHVHLKDVKYTTTESLDRCRDGRFIESCLWGEGLVPVKNIYEKLERDGYQGTCALEYVSPKQMGAISNDSQIGKFIHYLK